jgi:hypothetical protein
MKNAIKINVKKAPLDYDPSASKFFGAPAVPIEWQNDFDDDSEMFFCQIRLSDIAQLDTEGRLPHTGYLYVFLNTEDGQYRLRANLRYFDGEPDLVIDEFNSVVDGFERFTEAYLMEFSEACEDEICTRLFGIPSDWNYADEPPKLLMQYDPLDNEMDFLDTLDGFLYFFFDSDEKDVTKVTLHEEYT